MTRLLILIFCIMFATNLVANIIILEQGKAIVTMEDVDGFSMTIPKEKRHGYFDSPARIEYILTNILKIKHFINYAETLSVKYPDTLSKEVEQRLLAINKKTKDVAKTMKDEHKVQLLSDYIKLEEKYNYLKTFLKKDISIESIEELAEEEYMINKSIYSTQAIKGIRYISILYNKENKDEQNNQAIRILNQLKSENFSEYISQNFANDANIEVSKEITNFKYSKKYKEVSNFIFKDESKGLINDILDYNSRFNIFYVYSYEPKTTLPYEKVEEEIKKQLYKSKLERYFINLYSNLTQDKIEVNKEAIESLRSRFLPNKKLN